MDWNKELVEKYADVLREHESIGEALEEIREEANELISSSALRKAFQRYGFESPSFYLKQEMFRGHPIARLAPRSSEPVVESIEEDTPTYTLDFSERAYTLLYGDDSYSLSFDEVETACVMYSGVDPGLKKTAEEVAVYLHNDCGYDWVSPDIVQQFLKSIGQTKKRHPEAPHQMGDSHEAVFKQMRFRRNAAMSVVNKAEQGQKLAKEVDRLRKDFDTLIKAKDSLNDLTITDVTLAFDLDTNEGATLIIPIADLHLGKKVSPQPLSKEQNVYNKDIAQERVDQICSYIINHAFDEEYGQVYIAGMGDYWEALFLNMREGQHVDADISGIEQWKIVVESFVKIISTAREYFKCPIVCVVQAGNHDRVTRDKSFRSEEVLGYIFCDHLQAHFKSDPQVEVLYGAGVVSLALPNGVNLLTTHGHLSRMTKETDILKFTSVHGYPAASRYLVLQAHWHHFKLLTGYNFRAIWLPAICGNDLYNLNQLNTGSPSEFLMIACKPDSDQLIGPFPLT